MKTIHDVLREKEEKLAQKLQEIKQLEAQVAKLRGAIEIMKEEEHSETEILQFDVPSAPVPRPTAAPAVAPPVRNWP